MRSWGDTENLSLSDAELARCEPLAAEGGKSLRAFCPFHGSDKQRSLRVNAETGHFKCFACDAWGYLESARERRSDHPGGPAPRRMGNASAPPRQAPKPKPTPAPEPRPEIAELIERYRAALPGSPGEAYLAERRIPLDVAQRVGVGYAAPGQWAHVDETGRRVRDWRRGRLVFPHTNPAGEFVSLYGRAVGDTFHSDFEKGLKHDHLPGAKGYFNAQALAGAGEPVTVCEGAFDALALIAAGAPRVIAIFGVNGWRWDWAKDARALVFALDADAAGQAGFRELARAAALRGKRVAYLEPDAYGGEKDAAAAWRAGVLTLGDWREPFAGGSPGAHREPRPEDTPAGRPPGSDARSMLWGEALTACGALDVRPKQAAYELSYAYLEAGPAALAEIEAELWAAVAALPAGAPLPEALALEVFAWKNAAFMGRRRRDDELPSAWGEPAQAEHRRRYRGA